MLWINAKNNVKDQPKIPRECTIKLLITILPLELCSICKNTYEIAHPLKTFAQLAKATRH